MVRAWTKDIPKLPAHRSDSDSTFLGENFLKVGWELLQVHFDIAASPCARPVQLSRANQAA